MSEIRERLHAHRNDTLALLRQVTATAELHSGFRLAGAVGHIARAQVLLAEELFALPEGAEKEPLSTETQRVPSAQVGEDTPVDGVCLRE